MLGTITQSPEKAAEEKQVQMADIKAKITLTQENILSANCISPIASSKQSMILSSLLAIVYTKTHR